MKLKIQFIILFLFFVVGSACADNPPPNSCKNNELLLSVVDYSYCVKKNVLHSINNIGGNNSSVNIKISGYEYSFSRMPVSLALLDIPKKYNISVRKFFDHLVDINYSEREFSSIRNAFEISKKSLVAKYEKNDISAVYILNSLSPLNSIYLYSKDEEYIYIVKGTVDKAFVSEFLSNIKLQ